MESTTVEPKKRSKKPIVFVLIAVIVVVAVAGGLYYNNYTNGPCGVNRVKATSEQLKLIAQKWDDATQLASSTSRIALAGPVSQLQSSMRDIQNLDVPVCMIATRDALVSSMDSTIKGFVAFMSQKSDSEVTSNFTNARNYMDSFGSELMKVTVCAPNCQ